jgi:hypothetical protein
MLVAAGIGIAGLFLSAGAATFAVAALLRRLLPGIAAAADLAEGDAG